MLDAMHFSHGRKRKEESRVKKRTPGHVQHRADLVSGGDDVVNEPVESSGTLIGGCPVSLVVTVKDAELTV